MKRIYVAAHIKNLQEPYFLTSCVMQVEENIWLFDLAGVIHYWNHHCIAKKTSLAELLRHVFHRVDEQYLAVMAAHPWQALLKLQDLKNNRFIGFVSLFDSFNLKLYDEIMFSTWFETLELITPYLSDKNLREKIALFKRSLQRLLLNSIVSFKYFDVLAIKRRYSHTISTVLKWTFAGEEKGLFLSDFPWIPFKPKVILEVKRNLDYYINSWGEVAFLLCDDLDRLAEILSIKILKLKWHILLENLEVVTFDIDFRNPHALSLELKVHDTSLRQFESAFEKLRLKFKECDDVVMIAAWQIVADQMMSDTLIQHDFFSDTHLDDILKLENKLNVPLVRYRLTDDVTPEYSFEAFNKSSELTYNGLKPLFILPAPREISEKSHEHLLFTERVATHWWKDCYQVRDYFLEKSSKARWIYFDHISKKWYEHGYFG